MFVVLAVFGVLFLQHQLKILALMRELKALIALEDGTLFYGHTICCSQIVCGEIVFNTSMTGYQEICTDPSYANQIVLFTTPHIGNVGVNHEDNESQKPMVKGVVVREMSKKSSNWRSQGSLIEYLNNRNVAWIEGIDTRKLAKHIRNHGTKNACLMTGDIDPDLAVNLARRHIQKQDYRSQTAAMNNHNYTNQQPQITIYDFGVKSTLTQIFIDLGFGVTVVPHTVSADQLLAFNPDGIVFSNGPGDPAAIGTRIEEIRKILFSGIPILGICLGCQLIAIAAGGKTKKMTFGHHGANHPVLDLQKKKVFITSQNHNYVIDENTLPPEFEVTHISLFDGSVQGIKARNLPIIGFQGHPEGSPGPQDIKEIFAEFLAQVCLKDATRSLN